MRSLVTASLAVLAFVLSGSMVNSAMAQDRKAAKGAAKATMKVVAENARARAYEVTFAPGAAVSRPFARLSSLRQVHRAFAHHFVAPSRPWESLNRRPFPKETFEQL